MIVRVHFKQILLKTEEEKNWWEYSSSFFRLVVRMSISFERRKNKY